MGTETDSRKLSLRLKIFLGERGEAGGGEAVTASPHQVGIWLSGWRLGPPTIQEDWQLGLGEWARAAGVRVRGGSGVQA